MTKQAFLTAYRQSLLARYPWAQNNDKLERFLSSCEVTLNGGSSWNHDGDSVVDAWKAIGGQGKPTLKALRALPEA